MTGFGLSESFDKTSNISIEIRGVNHRFLELSIKSNNLGNDLEDFIREAISKNINRGKIEVKIKAKSSSKTKYDINKFFSVLLQAVTKFTTYFGRAPTFFLKKANLSSYRLRKDG